MLAGSVYTATYQTLVRRFNCNALFEQARPNAKAKAKPKAVGPSRIQDLNRISKVFTCLTVQIMGCQHRGTHAFTGINSVLHPVLPFAMAELIINIRAETHTQYTRLIKATVGRLPEERLKDTSLYSDMVDLGLISGVHHPAGLGRLRASNTDPTHSIYSRPRQACPIPASIKFGHLVIYFCPVGRAWKQQSSPIRLTQSFQNGAALAESLERTARQSVLLAIQLSLATYLQRKRVTL